VDDQRGVMGCRLPVWPACQHVPVGVVQLQSVEGGVSDVNCRWWLSVQPTCCSRSHLDQCGRWQSKCTVGSLVFY
jgi:hypothetical protein